MHYPGTEKKKTNVNYRELSLSSESSYFCVYLHVGGKSLHPQLQSSEFGEQHGSQHEFSEECSGIDLKPPEQLFGLILSGKRPGQFMIPEAFS